MRFYYIEGKLIQFIKIMLGNNLLDIVVIVGGSFVYIDDDDDEDSILNIVKK